MKVDFLETDKKIKLEDMSGIQIIFTLFVRLFIHNKRYKYNIQYFNQLGNTMFHIDLCTHLILKFEHPISEKSSHKEC